MLRMLVALALMFAVLWYLLREGPENRQAVEDDVAQMELATQAASADAAASAAMAVQADEARDAAIGGIAPASSQE